MLNYPCPVEVLKPQLPMGVELDEWQGQTLVSMVGFMFVDTRVRGFAVPGHRDFEEVNLRFYVRRNMPSGEVRRGVVFVRELVPKPLIAFTAQALYDEPYLAVPMHHRRETGEVSYGWRLGNEEFLLAGCVSGEPKPLQEGSEAEFITEHYWGYTGRREGRTSEYQVTHPRWKVWEAANASFTGNVDALYGAEFGQVLRQAPVSAFVALGSEVGVYPGRRF